jgi:murein DD-endopeptidase MepM/ murein hydrolase activator NlpD/cephalosporin-C deacetylase-like acetyl esterase
MKRMAKSERILENDAMPCRVLVALLLLACPLSAQPPLPARPPIVRAVDLDIGETRAVVLADGKKIAVKLLDVKEHKDDLREAIRLAQVRVAIDGQEATLSSGNYHLPQIIVGVRIDCPITRGYRANANTDVWGLVKDARLRFWPGEGPLQKPGTFVYPLKQRWFASMTQMANEPVYVDGGERPSVRKVYYHWGLDMGGPEEMVDVGAATDGLVVSSGKELVPGFEDTPAKPRYDVVYLLDEQGWYYRYSHLYTIDAAIKPGQRVKMGQKIGVLGKEGGSGGWSHLHFDITSKQPSGKWGIQEGYAFLWEAYHQEHKPKVIAVARPHHLASVGQEVTLDASRSWAAAPIKSYEWQFGDGTKATGVKMTRRYDKPGSYSEVLQVTDAAGSRDYDFAVVQVLDKSQPNLLPPTIHAAYAPSFGIKPGDEVTFKVRTFRTTQGHEMWDFGDGSAPVKVRSDGNVKPLAKDGYAVTTHRYTKPGHYLVRVQRSTDAGLTATTHLQVRVGMDSERDTSALRLDARLEKGTVRFVPRGDQKNVPERYRLQEHEFDWEMNPKGTLALAGIEVYELRFPSPLKTPHAENNIVHAEYYRPKKPGPLPCVIVLDITGGNQTLSRTIARHLAQNDIGGLFVQMAYYGPRRPKGSSMRLLSYNVEHTFAAIQQTVLDLRRAAAWMESRPEIDKNRLGIMGTSLGSFMAALTAEMEPKLGRLCVMLGGGGFIDGYYDHPLAGPYRKFYESVGGTKELLEQMIAPIDPITYAGNLKDRKVLIVAARNDEVVPPRMAENLWKATGQQRIIWLNTGHYSAVLYLVPGLTSVVEHFQAE